MNKRSKKAIEFEKVHRVGNRRERDWWIWWATRNIFYGNKKSLHARKGYKVGAGNLCY